MTIRIIDCTHAGGAAAGKRGGAGVRRVASQGLCHKAARLEWLRTALQLPEGRAGSMPLRWWRPAMSRAPHLKEAATALLRLPVGGGASGAYRSLGRRHCLRCMLCILHSPGAASIRERQPSAVACKPGPSYMSTIRGWAPRLLSLAYINELATHAGTAEPDTRAHAGLQKSPPACSRLTQQCKSFGHPGTEWGLPSAETEATECCAGVEVAPDFPTRPAAKTEPCPVRWA